MISIVPPYMGLLNFKEEMTRPDGTIEINVSIELDNLLVKLKPIVVAVNTILYKP